MLNFYLSCSWQKKLGIVYSYQVEKLILYRGQIISIYPLLSSFKPSVTDQFSCPVCSMIHWAGKLALINIETVKGLKKQFDKKAFLIRKVSHNLSTIRHYTILLFCFRAFPLLNLKLVWEVWHWKTLKTDMFSSITRNWTDISCINHRTQSPASSTAQPWLAYS